MIQDKIIKTSWVSRSTHYFIIMLIIYSFMNCAGRKAIYPDYNSVKLDWKNINDDAISLIKKAEYKEQYLQHCKPEVEHVSWKGKDTVVIEVKFIGIDNFTCFADHTFITVDTVQKKVVSVIK